MEIRVSVVIPVFNGERFIATAVRSALAQTLSDIEVLVADNGSTDGTWQVLEGLAAADDRVRILRATTGRGPDVGRNACIELARGEWLAMLDADDAMHPTRLERLLAFAQERGADVVADNQRIVEPEGRFLRLAWAPETLPARVDAAAFVLGNLFGNGPYLGYAKPLFRRALIQESGLRYSPRPRIIEDYQFMYALLRQGLELHFLPEALYDYVQVPGSLSRHFGEEDFLAVRAATQLHLDQAGGDERLRAALAARLRSIDLSLIHLNFVTAVKAGRLGRAAGLVLGDPAVLPLIGHFGIESLTKRLRRWAGGEQAANGATMVAYFGQDCTDNGVIRRITSFREAGLEVLGLTFRRQKFNRDYVPTWDNIALGETRDRNYLGRLSKLVQAAWIILRQHRRLSRASFFYARNIDMAMLAWFTQLVSRSKAPLVYEVMDVQRAFLGNRLSARFLRLVERRVLAHARLLVVTSPGFIHHYFAPMQGYTGAWFLLENKILGPQLRAMGDPLPAPIADREGRWVIGWFGTLRCVRSLQILTAIAEALPDKVLIYLRGYPTETGLDPFLEVVRRHPNMVYAGEFFSPRDLPSLYGAVDFAWGFDFLDAGGNSDWLLPNRLYDAGYFNVPVLAASSTQTGRMVEELGMGWTFRAPFGPSIAAFLADLSPQELAERRGRIAQLPRSLFCEEDDTRRMVKALLAPAPGLSAEPRSTEPKLGF